jgi:hypothetical protein
MTSERRVALLGAPGTGKTQLAQGLLQALATSGSSDNSGNSGTSTTSTVWQISEDSLLQQLAESWAQAAAVPSLTWLQVPEWQAAIKQQAGYQHTLLLGLVPGTPTAARETQAAASHQSVDGLLRWTLTQAGLPFQVIYGDTEAQLSQALTALEASPAHDLMPSQNQPRANWVWACDTCSDPVCEHRLLSDLLSARQT